MSDFEAEERAWSECGLHVWGANARCIQCGRPDLEALDAEVNALREALDWALDEGGWRLPYYAPFPIAIEVPHSTSPARSRTSEEIAAALAAIPKPLPDLIQSEEA